MGMNNANKIANDGDQRAALMGVRFALHEGMESLYCHPWSGAVTLFSAIFSVTAGHTDPRYLIYRKTRPLCPAALIRPHYVNVYPHL